MATLIKSPIAEPNFDWRNLDRARAQLEEFRAAVEGVARLTTAGLANHAIGRIVKFSVADSYAEYIVYSTKPLQLVHIPETYDISAAHMRGLKLADIGALIAFDDKWAGMMSDHDRFYENLPIGSIVHYDNGGAEFIRCERVEGEHGTRLVPLALVGNWDGRDLPRRMPDGSIRLGHQVEWINERRAFEPNYGSIWENYDDSRKEWSMRGLTSPDAPPAYLSEIGRERYAQKRYQAPFDPTQEPAIDLSVPGPTEDEKRLAEAIAEWESVKAALDVDDRDATADDYQQAIVRTRLAVEQAIFRLTNR